jgi:CRP/FNR family cyclic AMP-dependent transcriptional regulator
MAAATAKQLSAIPLLAALSPKELEAAAQLFTIRSYPKHAIVANEGDRLEMFNVVLAGNVQAFWRDEAGHQLKLGIDGPGDHFADVTLGGEPALVSHMAITDLRVAAIRMIDLKQLLRRHPQVATVLLMDVVARLRRLVQRTRTLTMEDVYGRVVKLLLACAVDAGGKAISERLTHAEIGQRVGATREMVGRVLRELSAGGYIKAEAGRISILRKPPSRR